jgi:hypothetical protein
MFGFLNEIKEHLRRNTAAYIAGTSSLLISSLFLVIWRRWFYGLLARNAQAIPREALGALIGVLSIFLLASLILVTYYALALKALRRKSTENGKVETHKEPDETELQFLKAISSHDRLTDEQIAGMFRLNLQRARYHLQHLCEIGYLIQPTPLILTGDPWAYYLTQEGRGFLITKKLL